MTIRSFSDKNNFSITVRLMRVVQCVIKHFHALMPMEGEIFLSLLIKLSEPDVAPFWQRVLVLEIYNEFCADLKLLRSVFTLFDSKEDSANIFQDIVQCLKSVILSERSLLSQGEPSTGHVSLGAASSGKMKSIDQLDKADPPNVPETYLIFLGFTGISSLVCVFSTHSKQKVNQMTFADLDEPCIIEMSKISWAAVHRALAFLLTASLDSDLYNTVARDLSVLTGTLGRLELNEQRDTCLSTLCRSSLPQATQSLGSDSAPTSFQPKMLSERNIVALKALMSVCQTLEASLGEESWYLVLETLNTADSLASPGRREARNRTSAESPVGIASNIEMFFNTTSTSMDYPSFREFARALCRLAKTQCIEKSTENAESFAISRIYGICMINIHRLIGSVGTKSELGRSFELWDMIVVAVVYIAHHPVCPPAIRDQVCTGLGQLLNEAIQAADLTNPQVEVKILSPLKLLIVSSSNPGNAEADLSLANGGLETLHFGLDILNRLLQAAGQNFVEGWSLVFEILKAAIGRLISRRAFENGKNVSAVTEAVDGGDGGSGTTVKSTALIRIAFPSLQLICTDFLSLLYPPVLHDCVETVYFFGLQQDDLNISLAAIGLLWTVSDFVLEKKQSDLAKSVPKSQDWKSMDEIWMFLLAKLSELCSNERPEVRNTASQTLFRTIGMNGKKLTIESWSECIWRVLFPLLERVKLSSLEDQELSSPVSVNLLLHHSRNTTAKQWDETKVLALNGVSKCIVDYFPILFSMKDFDRAWSSFLSLIEDWYLGDSPEVSMASIKSLKTLVTNLDRDESKALLREKTWKTWESIGHGIISRGAAQSDHARLCFFHGHISQEALTAFVLVLFDLYPLISDSFTLNDLRSMFSIICALPLYHTIPTSGATVGRLRLDVINDLDSPSALQASILNIIHYDESNQPKSISSSLKAVMVPLDFSRVHAATEEKLVALAKLTRLPFVQSTTGSNPQGFTYIAMAKLSIGHLMKLFESSGRSSKLYNGDIFLDIIRSLGIAMKEKYRCPDVGAKTATTLWKISASAFMRILKVGLEYMNEMKSCIEMYFLIMTYSS